MDNPIPRVGDFVRLIITDAANLAGTIRHGTVTDVGMGWVRVRVGNGSLVLRWDQLADHERRCCAAELADVQASAKRGGK